MRFRISRELFSKRWDHRIRESTLFSGCFFNPQSGLLECVVNQHLNEDHQPRIIPHVNQSRRIDSRPSIISQARPLSQATQRLRHFLQNFVPVRIHPNTNFTHSPQSHFSPFTNSRQSQPNCPPI